jgi:hypothetical protein
MTRPRRVIACNFAAPDAEGAKAGATAYVRYLNWDGSPTIPRLIKQNKRWIERHAPIRQLVNFRFVTLPPQHELRARLLPTPPDAELERLQEAAERAWRNNIEIQP